MPSASVSGGTGLSATWDEVATGQMARFWLIEKQKWLSVKKKFV